MIVHRVESLKAVTTIDNTFADIRVQPDVVAKKCATLSNDVQERLFIFTLEFIKALAVQDATGAYVNGNMEIARQARDIQETVLTFLTYE